MNLANPNWESTLCGCYSYRTPQTEELRFCPLFCPYSCCCPCVMLGRIKTMLDKEKELCCGMGCQGCSCCILTCLFPPCQTCLSASLRSDVAKDFRVENGGTCCDTCKGFCCVPCSAFQVFVSLEYWLGKVKAQKERGGNTSSSSSSSRNVPRTNTATEIVLSHLGETHTFDEADIEAAESKQNEPRQASPRPSMSSNVSRDSSNKSTKYSKVEQSESPHHHNPHRNSQSSTRPGRESTTSRDSSIRVAIPAGHFAGSKFEVEGSNGDSVLVVVPPGGKPGMLMDVVV